MPKRVAPPQVPPRGETDDPPAVAPAVAPPGDRVRRRWLQTAWSAEFGWSRHDLPIAGLPPSLAGLRVVHLTDLHVLPPWRRAYDRLIARLAASPPDLLLFTGDLVEDKFDHRPALPTAERLVRAVAPLARLGTWATVGNHDGDLLAARLPGWGVNLLDGRLARLTAADGAALDLLGLPGVDRRDLPSDWLAALPPRPDRGVRLALSHYPDHVRRLALIGPDVTFAGHTHGGQVCLPGGRPILTHDSLPRAMSAGVHRWADGWLVVGRGFGFSKYPVRAFCPAEVVEVTLTPARAFTPPPRRA